MTDNKTALKKLFWAFTCFLLIILLLPQLIFFIQDTILVIEKVYIVIAISLLLGYFAWGLEAEKNTILKVVSYSSKVILYMAGVFLLILLIKIRLEEFLA